LNYARVRCLYYFEIACAPWIPTLANVLIPLPIWHKRMSQTRSRFADRWIICIYVYAHVDSRTLYFTSFALPSPRASSIAGIHVTPFGFDKLEMVEMCASRFRPPCDIAIVSIRDKQRHASPARARSRSRNGMCQADIFNLFFSISFFLTATKWDFCWVCAIYYIGKKCGTLHSKSKINTALDEQEARGNFVEKHVTWTLITCD